MNILNMYESIERNCHWCKPGLHKIETGLGTKFQDKFSAWFSRNFMLSGKSENVHFILSYYI